MLPAEHEFFVLLHDLLLEGRSPCAADLERVCVLARGVEAPPIDFADPAAVRPLLDSFVNRYCDGSTGPVGAPAPRNGARNAARALLRAMRRSLRRARTVSRPRGRED